METLVAGFTREKGIFFTTQGLGGGCDEVEMHDSAMFNGRRIGLNSLKGGVDGRVFALSVTHGEPSAVELMGDAFSALESKGLAYDGEGVFFVEGMMLRDFSGA